MSRRPGMPGRSAWAALAAIAVGCLVLDQASKAVVVASLEIGDRVEVVPGVDLAHVTNPGIAFGFLGDGPGLILPVTLLALAGVLAWFAFEGGRRALMWLPAGLLVGGALGNLIDRLRLGHVTDFIDLPYWPTFNVADVAITVGVVIMIAMVLFGDEPSSEARPAEDDGAAGSGRPRARPEP